MRLVVLSKVVLSDYGPLAELLTMAERMNTVVQAGTVAH